MKKRILCLLLTLVMVISMFALVACNDDSGDDTGDSGNNGGNTDTGNGNNGGNTGTGGNGGDSGNTGTGGNPGGIIGGGSDIVLKDWWDSVTYDETTLRFKLTECENAGLYPNTKRLLQGDPEESLNRVLDTLITERNDNAYFNTNVTVLYDYYDDNADLYGWGKAMSQIQAEVGNQSVYSPDMYCNFMSDMLATSLKGSFANLYSRVRGFTGEGEINNYFIPNEVIGNQGYAHTGYMSDLMSSLTLSQEKIYVIASDYFIDLIRAFFVVPVNQKLYNQIAVSVDEEGKALLEDLNEDGVKNMDDFFEEVKNGDWTYKRLAEYCSKIAVDKNQSTNWDMNDTLGFALDYNGGMMASGLMYTTSLVIIEKNFNEETYTYSYAYPTQNDELIDFSKAVKTLFETRGVTAVANSDTPSGSAVLGISQKFAAHELLFGGIITVGNLENSTYQDMKGEEGGFGVVPVPVYREGDEYQTAIHTSGGAGGISHVTTKFTQCTAFLQYQSTHSTEILNEYYDNNLTVDVSDGMQGNVDMLQYIRANVRTAFDKLFEDAIGFFNRDTDAQALSNRWHQILMTDRFLTGDNMREKYDGLVGTKKTRLAALVDEYKSLPN